jgi:multiple sugar transport system ATP-binding protein
VTALTLENIRKSFGSTAVLHDISLTVAKGEFVVFVGPSGCGKSTLLRSIAGLEDVSAGRVLIGGRDVTALPPAKRGIAMVFQSYALYPHLDVAGNMALGLRQAGEPPAVVNARVDEAARMLALGAYMQRRPAELSGGQRQRVAIGRAVVRKPDLFLFDEPLSNLDAALRMATRVEIARLHRDLGTAMIYVTHDQTEAMTLADTIVVMQAGRIEQTGAPLDLYNDPANRFVAGFLGSPAMNFLPGAVIGDAAHEVGIRPEHMRLDPDGPLEGTIAHVERLGGDTNLIVSVGAQLMTVRLFGQHPQAVGDAVRLATDPARMLRFGPDGARLR